MCWFSVHGRITTRKAIEGEELVIQDFPGNHHRWLASTQNLQKAVCLADGCKLRLNAIPEDLQRKLHVGSEAVAEFRELYQPAPMSLLQRILPRPFFYDVLVFPDGNRIEISRLPLGMKIDVLCAAVVEPVLKENDAEKSEPVYAARC
jgi:hypothetical protein